MLRLGAKAPMKGRLELVTPVPVDITHIPRAYRRPARPPVAGLLCDRRQETFEDVQVNLAGRPPQVSIKAVIGPLKPDQQMIDPDLSEAFCKALRLA